jgi:hypothetical protein
MWCFFLETKVRPARRGGRPSRAPVRPGGAGAPPRAPAGPGADVCFIKNEVIFFSQEQRSPPRRPIIARVFCAVKSKKFQGNAVSKSRLSMVTLRKCILATLIIERVFFAVKSKTFQGKAVAKSRLSMATLRKCILAALIIAYVFCVVKSRTFQGSGHPVQSVRPTQPGEGKRHGRRQERIAQTARTAPILQRGETGEQAVAANHKPDRPIDVCKTAKEPLCRPAGS